MWDQATLTLPPLPRGFHLITDSVVDSIPQLSSVAVGLLHLFLHHTSAGLTINENTDPDVRRDFRVAANHLCPESLDFRHSDEGPDDMPAHVLSTLTGCQVTIPVRQGRLALGQWQGIYLCEFRNDGGERRLVWTLHGRTYGD